MLDELLIGGEVQETSKKNVLKAIAAQDLLQEVGQDPTCDHSYNPSISQEETPQGFFDDEGLG